MGVGLSALDFAQIRQLHSKYCHTVDFGDFEGVASVFAPDGRFEIVSNADHPANRQGYEAMKQSPGVRGTRGHCRHTTLSSVTNGDGNTAKSVSVVVMTLDYGPAAGKYEPTRSVLFATGLYVDELVKIDGNWCYAYRGFLGGADITARVGQALEIEPLDAGATEQELTELDYEAIRQVTTRACYALDFEDHAGFAACFTPDGAYDEVIAQGDLPPVRSTITGRAALEAHSGEVGKRGHDGFVRHNAVNQVIEGNGERALVSSYCLVVVNWGHAQPRQPLFATVLQTGIYRDEVVKVEGRWLLSRRTFRKDTMDEVKALVGQPLGLTHFAA